MRRNFERLRSIVVFSIFAVSMNSLTAAPYCGELDPPGQYGPFDYTNAEERQLNLPVVEAHHFTPDIESLAKGASGNIGGDLDYTLRAFPNHHRALATLVKFAARTKTQKPRGAKYSVDCYFERAIRFKPNDATVRMLYGNYLLKAGRAGDATAQLNEAFNLQPENPSVNYNLGLAYMQKKDYEQARTHAKKAYELGFPLPGLKNQLIQAGKWED